MSDFLVSFRSAAGEGNYQVSKWSTTNTHIVASGIASPVAHLNERRSRRFTHLAEQWEQETRFMSSVTDIIDHPAYRAVIAMGRPAINLILDRLESYPAFWFQALHEISGENPVKPEDSGDIELMAEAWLEWGAKRNNQ